MKKIIVASVALLGFLFLNAQFTKIVFAQKGNIKKPVETTVRQQDIQLANQIRQLTNRSAEGLVMEKIPGGGIKLDLKGRFQNVVVSRLESDGSPTAACVTSLGEANHFFGRNLETGELLPRKDFKKDSLTDVASRHGMTVKEYKFYTNLIERMKNQKAFSPSTSTIFINNNDGMGEGFNDMTATMPEGGNTGATLGMQRLNVFEFAADIWEAFLDSSVDINVDATFDPQFCDSTSATLGAAGALNAFANFTNAPLANTWHHVALANKQAGTDLDTMFSDISAAFNSTLDGTDMNCLGGDRFYLGLDNAPPADTINLLVVVLHELGHGLGFSSFVTTLEISGATNAMPIEITTTFNHGLTTGDMVTIEGAMGNTNANGTHTITVTSATQFTLDGTMGNGMYTGGGIIRGALLLGLFDVYTTFTFDRTTGLLWNNKTTAQRSASLINPGNVLWDGENVKIASGNLTAGRDNTNGQVELYTPNPFEGGSSLSHFSDAATPNLLMEPIITVGLPIDLDLTRQQMRDIGWYRDSDNDLNADTITNVMPNSGTFSAGDMVTATWTNDVAFTRDVIVELSTDGGMTFPIELGSGVTNSGSFMFTMPNVSTSQGRIRIREDNFVDPAGVSSSDFTVQGTTAALATVGGRVFARNGRALYKARVKLTNQNGGVKTAITNPFGYYRFTDLPVGETYTLSVEHKWHAFSPQVVNLNDNLTNLNFTAIK